jgi:AraC-like DNA-binding protein
MLTAETNPIQYFPPDDDLAELISTFYIARFSHRNFDEYERADRPQLRLLFSPGGEYHLPGGTVVPAGRAIIIGPTSAPVRALSEEPVSLVGMGLMPGGWATLMGPEADKFADRAVDAADMFGDWIVSTADAIAAAPDDATRLVMLQNLAREVMRRGDPAPLWFTRTVDAWLAASLSPEVDDLVAATGMSIRSVERMTKRFYGLSPKLLARKYRALRAASALMRGESLDETDIAGAFYDQSHLIREVKQFAGVTPSQLARPSAYGRATTAGRRELAGRVSPLISHT